MIESIKAHKQTSEMTHHDLVRHVFSLSELEGSAYAHLQSREMTVLGLSRKLDRDRTTAQRVLKRLASSGLVHKRVHIPKGGGRKYYYAALETDVLKGRMHKKADAWHAALKQRIELI